MLSPKKENQSRGGKIKGANHSRNKNNKFLRIVGQRFPNNKVSRSGGHFTKYVTDISNDIRIYKSITVNLNCPKNEQTIF